MLDLGGSQIFAMVLCKLSEGRINGGVCRTTQGQTKPPHLELQPVTGEQRQHTEPVQGSQGRGGGVYRHHFINEQESWAVLQMNEGGVSVFWCDWVQKGPVCWPGSGTMPNGSHFPYQLIKQPYLHPSLGPEPNNVTSRGAQDCPKPPAYFQLFYIYFQLDQAETKIMITAFVSGFRFFFFGLWPLCSLIFAWKKIHMLQAPKFTWSYILEKNCCTHDVFCPF